jgi:hypothetical protein
MRRFETFETWATQRWPGWLLNGGWVLFAMACVNSARLPVEALLVGPGMMLAAVAVKEAIKRESR